MQGSAIYGEMQSDKLVADNEVVHQIVKEIGHFGVNDRQRWLIIYYLAMELESIEEMKSLTSYIKERKGKEIFITKMYGAEEEQDGSTN